MYMPPHLSPEEVAALKLQVSKNEEEIRELRRWRHEAEQRPNADGLRLQLIETTLTQVTKELEKGNAQNDRILTSLNGDDTKMGIRGRLEKVETAVTTCAALMNGLGPDEPGMNGWLDRLERVWGVVRREVWVIVGAIVVLLVKVFWGAIGGQQTL